jgi:hypothetical protein
MRLKCEYVLVLGVLFLSLYQNESKFLPTCAAWPSAADHREKPLILLLALRELPNAERLTLEKQRLPPAV